GHQQQLPDPVDLQRVEVKMAVIDGGALLHRHAAAVIAAVADGDLQGLHACRTFGADDLRMKRLRLGEDAQRSERIAQAAEAALSFPGEGIGEIRGEAEARDIEEIVAVDLAEIDLALPAGGD